MTPEQQQHFDDLIIKAVQSGKQETSGLVDTILHKIDSHIEESINRNVNGKINLLTQKVDNYVKQDNEWKIKAEPVIQMGQQVQGFGKVSLYIVGFVASVGGAVLLIINMFKKE